MELVFILHESIIALDFEVGFNLYHVCKLKYLSLTSCDPVFTLLLSPNGSCVVEFAVNGSLVFGVKLLPKPSSKPPKPLLFSSNVVANWFILDSLCVPLLKPCALSLNGSVVGSCGLIN